MCHGKRSFVATFWTTFRGHRHPVHINSRKEEEGREPESGSHGDVGGDDEGQGRYHSQHTHASIKDTYGSSNINYSDNNSSSSSSGIIVVCIGEPPSQLISLQDSRRSHQRGLCLFVSVPDTPSFCLHIHGSTYSPANDRESV